MGLNTVFEVELEDEVVANTAIATIPTTQPPAVDFREDQTADYLLSRDIYRDLIRRGQNAITEINSLAGQLESPRAYEVMATLMKQVTETTDKLMELQKKNKELYDLDNKTKVEDTGRITVEKAVFVGTSDEMLKRVRETVINGSE